MTPQAVLWTARVAVLCWLASRVLRLRGRDEASTRRWELFVSSTGCVVYLLHVVAAFGLVHHWSHAAAWDQTARDTTAVVRLDWGGGLWFNYLFTLLWPLDEWRRWSVYLQGRRYPHWWGRMVETYLAFIVVNATLLFGPRWWWSVFGAALASVLWSRRCKLGDH